MLHNELIFLRALEADDLDFLYALENETALWTVADAVTPVSRYTLRQYLDNAAADFHEVRQLRLIICTVAARQAVGAIDLFDFEPRHQRAGVGIALLPEQQKRGYGQAALACMIDYARQTLHLHQLHCSIEVSNHASQNLFERLGFELVGVRKQWLRTAIGWQDVGEYQLLLNVT